MACILIADDQADTAQYLYKTLTQAGHTVVRADNALKAWKILNVAAFDAILVSAVMSGVDGFILAQKALLGHPQTQIVFLTGFSAVPMIPPLTAVTPRPFHIREMPQRLQALWRGEWSSPTPHINAGHVVQADFSRVTPQ